MPIKINGTNTAANPSITGSDTDTGIVYGSDQIDFSTGGTSRATIDGSGHLKFTGTTEEITLQTSDGSDNGYLNLSGGGACSQNRAAQVVMYGNERTDQQGQLLLMAGNSGNTNGTVGFYTGGSKRLQIGSDGKTEIIQSASGSTTSALHLFRPSAASNAAVDMIHFDSGNQGRGKLVSASSDAGSPALASRSDYRIKENIREYTGGWDNIKAVPVKLFDVKTDGSKDQKGWIAHELQAVLPDLVQGTKDAVDDNNDPIYQSVSMGLFMPDVVSALQTAIAKIETLETENDKLQTDLTALTARVAALEAV